MKQAETRRNNKYIRGKTSRPVSITWQTSIAIEKIARLEVNTFYYEGSIEANIPLIDAVIVNPARYDLLQITKSPRHKFSQTGFKKVIKNLPTKVKELNYILIYPIGINRDAKLPYTTVDTNIKFAQSCGKILNFYFAEVAMKQSVT